jgi:hypothetical protein
VQLSEQQSLALLQPAPVAVQHMPFVQGPALQQSLDVLQCPHWLEQSQLVPLRQASEQHSSLVAQLPFTPWQPARLQMPCQQGPVP